MDIIIAVVIIAAAAAYLVYGGFKTFKGSKKGCSTDCGCGARGRR